MTFLFSAAVCPRGGREGPVAGRRHVRVLRHLHRAARRPGARLRPPHLRRRQGQKVAHAALDRHHVRAARRVPGGDVSVAVAHGHSGEQGPWDGSIKVELNAKKVVFQRTLTKK